MPLAPSPPRKQHSSTILPSHSHDGCTSGTPTTQPHARSSRRLAHIAITASCIIALIFAVANPLVYLAVQHNDRLRAAEPLLARFFYVDREQSLPTYFSVFLLLCVSLLSLRIAALAKVPRLHRRGFLVTGLAFAYLTVDEGLALHEMASRYLQTTFDLQGVFYYSWTIPAVALLAVFGVLVIRFWISLPTDVKWRLAVAGCIFVSGAVGLEMVGSWLDSSGRRGSFAYVAAGSAEEFLEMLGTILAISAVLQYPTYSRVGRLTIADVRARLRDGSDNVQIPHSR